MPAVSVVIPVYNAEKYIASALDSVLGQSFSDIEIVCVNDGSTDRSAEILERYQSRDDRIKVVYQENSGGSAARNMGIRQATGEYIMFLDSDDAYAKDIIAKAHKRALETDADVVFYNFARFVGRPTRMAVVNRATPKKDIQLFTKETYSDRFFNDFAIITWNKLIRRSVIDEGGVAFDTSLSHNHDVDFSIRLMLAAKSYSWLNEVGYFYRSNDSGLTATRRSDPTNVLKIILNLNKIISAKYDNVKPSYNRYVVDMIAGTIIKYSKDEEAVRELFEFSRNVVIPEVGIKSGQESAGIVKIVETGSYEELQEYLASPRRKLRSFARSTYDLVQAAAAKFPV